MILKNGKEIRIEVIDSGTDICLYEEITGYYIATIGTNGTIYRHIGCDLTGLDVTHEGRIRLSKLEGLLMAEYTKEDKESFRGKIR